MNLREAMGSESGSNFDYGIFLLFSFSRHHWRYLERRVEIWNDFWGSCFGFDFCVGSHVPEAVSEIGSDEAVDHLRSEVRRLLAKDGWTS
jgi:hypothetical protein